MGNLTKKQQELVDNLINGFEKINESSNVKSDNIFYELVEDVERDNKRKEELMLLDKVNGDRFLQEFYDDVEKYYSMLEEIGFRFSRRPTDKNIIYGIETFNDRFLSRYNKLITDNTCMNQLSFEFKINRDYETIIDQRIYFATSYKVIWNDKVEFKNLSEAFSNEKVKETLKILIDLTK